MVTQAFPRLCLTDRVVGISFSRPSPLLGSLYTRFSQCSKAMSEESCPEVHVKRAYYFMSIR